MKDADADGWLIRLPGAPAGSRVTYTIHANSFSLAAVAGPWCYQGAGWRVASGSARHTGTILEFTEPHGSDLCLRIEPVASATHYVLEPHFENIGDDARHGAAQRRFGAPATGQLGGVSAARRMARGLDWHSRSGRAHGGVARAIRPAAQLHARRVAQDTFDLTPGVDNRAPACEHMFCAERAEHPARRPGCVLRLGRAAG